MLAVQSPEVISLLKYVQKDNFCETLYNSMESVKILLGAGAEVDTQDKLGRTALMLAISHPAICMELLKNGASPNMSDYYGQTSLHNAAQTSNVKAIKLLLKAGAVISVQDQNGRTPLSIAESGKNPKVIKLLKNL